jgi:hypothetical protein
VPVEQQWLILARAQARQDGQVLASDVPAMVKKAGLKVNGGGAELSTTTAGTGTRATTRPAGKSKVPTKADIRAMCERAGLDVA